MGEILYCVAPGGPPCGAGALSKRDAGRYGPAMLACFCDKTLSLEAKALGISRR
jgi:hypothetical protein